MPAQQGQQNQGDNSMAFLWITVAIFVFVLLLWFIGHAVIVEFVFKIRLLEISIISLFTNALAPVAQMIQTTDPAAVTFTQLEAVSTQVGKYLRFPVLLILAGFAIVLYNNSIKTRFRKSFDMQRLWDQEVENWPQNTPARQLKLINEDIEKGEWAMAIAPMQFCKKYKLLKEKEPDKNAEEVLITQKHVEVEVVRSKATQVFARQMGNPWRGVDHLPKYAQALFAVFAAKANEDREASMQLLRQIAASSSDLNKLDFTGADELLAKHRDTKLIQEIVNKHAYELTVMASMIELSRIDGVMASAEFLWLKPVDRPLWYMLNCVGRRTCFAEVAGPFAHWLAEKGIGRKLTVPMIDEAVVGLEQAVAEVLYIPDDE